MVKQSSLFSETPEGVYDNDDDDDDDDDDGSMRCLVRHSEPAKQCKNNIKAILLYHSARQVEYNL